MLKYKVREWVMVEYDMSPSHFKNYVVDVRGFYSSYRSRTQPDFYQLMREADNRGFITECATIPYGMVGDVEDLGEWWNNNYEEVYNYLKENSQELY